MNRFDDPTQAPSAIRRGTLRSLNQVPFGNSDIGPALTLPIAQFQSAGKPTAQFGCIAHCQIHWDLFPSESIRHKKRRLPRAKAQAEDIPPDFASGGCLHEATGRRTRHPQGLLVAEQMGLSAKIRVIHGEREDPNTYQWLAMWPWRRAWVFWGCEWRMALPMF